LLLLGLRGVQKLRGCAVASEVTPAADGKAAA
jgi:hypothetical protein